MSNGDQAYDLGECAGREGTLHTANPYPGDSGLGTAWNNGWERGRFDKLLSEAKNVEDFHCPECGEGKARRVLTSDGKWVWDPEGDLGISHESDQDADGDKWLFCKLCSSVFEKDWQEQLAQELLYAEPDEIAVSTHQIADSETKEAGFVYVVRSELIRIGKAKSESRYKSYRRSLPKGCEILKVWLVKLPLVAEDSLHKKYSPYRVHGSWYDLPQDKLRELLATSEFPKPAVLIRVHESQPTL